ncbi:2530_t:CDS:2, partial [Acaulospora morrowiae]
DSISSDSSQGTGAALFFSVPNLQPEAEILESISLQTSNVQHYNQYDEEDEYQGSEPETAFLAGVPNENGQNKQTPADIYQDAPIHIPRASNNSLIEGLLPSTSIPPKLSSGIAHRKFRDPVFAVLFILGSVVMIISGIVLLCTTSSSPLKDYQGGSVFFAIRDST